jgi:hypothetical protein
VRQRDGVPDHNRAWEFVVIAESEVSDARHQEVIMNVLNLQTGAVEMLTLDEVGQW